MASTSRSQPLGTAETEGFDISTAEDYITSLEGRLPSTGLTLGELLKRVHGFLSTIYRGQHLEDALGLFRTVLEDSDNEFLYDTAYWTPWRFRWRQGKVCCASMLPSELCYS